MPAKAMNSEQLYMVFDVESVGLHGEGFSVGYIVVDSKGVQCDSGVYSCPPDAASGSAEGRQWVKEHCPPIIITHDKPRGVRAAFWSKWLQWKGKDALLFADCHWPVETRFLEACVDDDPVARSWQGPYPLHDIASILLAHAKNPIAQYPRNADELPEHDPKADARQSARILIETLAHAI